MNSMTGYGRGEAAEADEIHRRKQNNRKQAELSLYLPRELDVGKPRAG